MADETNNVQDALANKRFQIKLRKKLKENVDYKKLFSKASCRIDEIQGFIFGVFSSRFWMMRKNISAIE